MLAVWDFLATILLNAFVQFIFFYFYAIHYIEFKEAWKVSFKIIFCLF